MAASSYSYSNQDNHDDKDKGIVECGNQRNEKYAVGRFFQKSENLLKTMVGRQHVNRAPPSVKIGEQQLYGTSQSLL